jgi:hypothetical protein
MLERVGNEKVAVGRWVVKPLVDGVVGKIVP